MPDTTTEDYLPETLAEFDSLISRLMSLIREVEEKAHREEAPIMDIIADRFMAETPEVLTQYHESEREASAFTFGLPVFGADTFERAKLAEDPLHYGACCEWAFGLAKAYLTGSGGAQEFLRIAAVAAMRYTKETPPREG